MRMQISLARFDVAIIGAYGALHLMLPAILIAADPDPNVLLVGAASARESISKGRIQGVLNSKRSDLQKPTVIDFYIEFDGVNITMREKRKLVRYQLGAKDPDAFQKHIAAMDDEAIVKAGLGVFRNQELRQAWDGEKRSEYVDGDASAAYVEGTEGHGLLFNPRIIGLSTNYFFEDAIQKLLVLDKPATATLIGSEIVNGRATWHVKQIARNGLDSDYWIEATKNFRVHRIVKRVAGFEWTIESKFENDDGVLPNVVTVQMRSQQPQVKFTSDSRLELTLVNLVDPVPSDTGSLSSLKIPYGKAIDDFKLGRRVGYWDGAGEISKAPLLSAERKPAFSDSLVTWLAAIATLLAAVVAVLVWRRAVTHKPWSK